MSSMGGKRKVEGGHHDSTIANCFPFTIFPAFEFYQAHPSIAEVQCRNEAHLSAQNTLLVVEGPRYRGVYRQHKQCRTRTVLRIEFCRIEEVGAAGIIVRLVLDLWS